MVCSAVSMDMPNPLPHYYEDRNRAQKDEVESRALGSQKCGMTEDDLRRALREFMAERGLKPWSWSEAAGLAGGTLDAFLKGTTESMRHATLAKLARAAGVDIAVLLQRANVPASTAGASAMLEEEVKNSQMMLQVLRDIKQLMESNKQLLERNNALLEELAGRNDKLESKVEMRGGGAP